jgi:7 transmembrane helices usually fused to an inactive transglutaminase
MKRPLSAHRRPAALVLLLVPVVIAGLRAQSTPLADFLNGTVNLANVHGSLHGHLTQLLFVPLSAVVVAVFRLTLGFRVLGLFRPILLALAFHATGIVPGLALLVAALAVISIVRPLLKGTHSFVRLAIVLTLVSTMLVAAGLMDSSLASFPVVALCLTCETFAQKLRSRGANEAMARTAATVAPAVVITLIAGIPGLFTWLLEHPEMLLGQIGAVLAVDGWLNLRLLSAGNPRVPAPLRPIAHAAKAAAE